MNRVVVRRADPRDAAVWRLVEDLDALLASLYPVASNHFLDIEALASPDMRFAAALADGEVVGCGGIRPHADCAEVKRVYVDPKARGRGVSRAIMAHLEDEARNVGKMLARLETGVRQPEALGLYRTLGYAERGPFGDYKEDPLSVFMEKRLM